MMWPFKTAEKRTAELKVKITALEEMKKGKSEDSKEAMKIDKKIEKLNHKMMHLQRKAA